MGAEDQCPQLFGKGIYVGTGRCQLKQLAR
jgi:hypothetical protein